LQEAEQQLIVIREDPPSTALQRQYVLTSRNDQRLRKRKTTIGSVIGFTLVDVASIFAVLQQNEAVSQSKIARARELASQSAAVREQNSQVSMLLGVEAYKILDTIQSRGVLLDNAQSNPQFRQTLVGHTSPVNSIVFSPDGKTLASGSEDGAIILWELGEGTYSIKYSIKVTSAVLSLALSPDGKILAIGNKDHTITLLNASTGQPIGNPLSKHVASVNSVAFSPDGKTLASGSLDGAVFLWDVESGMSMHGWRSNAITKNGVNSVAFNSDGKILASGFLTSPSDIFQTNLMLVDITVWNMGSPDKGQWLDGQSGSVLSVAFSPNNKFLASGGVDKNIFLWDVSKWGDMRLSDWNKNMMPPDPLISWRLSGHVGDILSLAFNQDSEMLASGSKDNTVILWDVNNHQPIGQPLSNHTDSVNSVVFSPNGKAVASGSSDRTIILWDTNPEAWIEKSCQNAGRNFTRLEWEQYFPNEEYHATCSQWKMSPKLNTVPFDYHSYSLWAAAWYLIGGGITYGVIFLRTNAYSTPDNSIFTWKYIILSVVLGMLLMFPVFIGVYLISTWTETEFDIFASLAIIPSTIWVGFAYSHYTRFQTGNLSRLKRIMSGCAAGFLSVFLFFFSALSLATVWNVTFLDKLDINKQPIVTMGFVLMLFFSVYLIIAGFSGCLGGVVSIFGSLLYIFGIQKWVSKRRSRLDDNKQ
jgi:WD40 repeat protein